MLVMFVRFLTDGRRYYCVKTTKLEEGKRKREKEREKETRERSGV